MVSVCVPVLNRYDLLVHFVSSLNAGSIRPDRLCVVDNGKNPDAAFAAVRHRHADIKLDLLVPDESLGLAASWNHFIACTDDERVIVNDDVEFSFNSLARMLHTSGDFVSGLAGTNAFSCFLIRDACVEKVGLFDESISPGYAYFEDLDYRERMLMHGVPITACECGVVHHVSQTIKAMASERLKDHHRRFCLAQENFINKWGYLPAGVERQRV